MVYKEELSVNLNQTSVMRYIQRRNLSDTQGQKIYGRNLQVKDMVKYLRVTLDTRFMYKFHLEIIITSATRAL